MDGWEDGMDVDGRMPVWLGGVWMQNLFAMTMS